MECGPMARWPQGVTGPVHVGGALGDVGICPPRQEERQATEKETKERKEFTLQVWNQRGEGICRGSGCR